MFSISLSVSTLRFYLELSLLPNVVSIVLKPPNYWYVLFQDGSYRANRFNGFASHVMIMPKYTAESLSAFLRSRTYHRNHDRKGLDHHLLLRDVTITQTYIEFDHNKEFRFPIDVDMSLQAQASHQSDRLDKMLEPLFSPMQPFLKFERSMMLEVHRLARENSRFSFARPFHATSAFVLQHNTLYFAYTSKSQRVPVPLTSEFTSFATPNTVVFPIHNQDLSCVYEGMKKNLVSEVSLIPLWDSYIIEGRHHGVLQWKWHAKGVETAHFLTPVIRSVETSDHV